MKKTHLIFSITIALALAVMLQSSAYATQPFPPPYWEFSSEGGGYNTGTWVNSAGDVNNDGYDDIIVGADGYTDPEFDEGAAFVFFGSASGPSATPDWMAEGNQNFSRYGHSVASAGDVNDDGYDDIIVGCVFCSNGQTYEGQAFVYYGSASGPSLTPDWTGESNQANAYYGRRVGTAGDVNNDGFDDVIVGGEKYDGVAGENVGKVWVYYGSAAGLNPSPDWTYEGPLAGGLVGDAADTAGDVNGDGYDDVIVGAPFTTNGHTNEGRVYAWYGSASGLNPAPDWIVEGNATDSNLGYAVSYAGDLNSDGYDDVLVGSPGYDGGMGARQGRALVYYGSASGLNTNPGWSVLGEQANCNFGSSVRSAGDVNNDSHDDVIIGAPMYNSLQGRVYIYYGSASGPGPTVNWMTDGENANDLFGYSVSTAGHANDSGYESIVVGAKDYSGEFVAQGRVYVYQFTIAWIDKTAEDLNGPPLYEGDVLQYTITVTNADDVEIPAMTISDTIPAYTTYVWDSDDPEADVETGSLLAWQDKTLPAGSTATYLFQVTVDQGAAGQTIQNTAQLQVGEAITSTPPVEPPGGGDVQPTPGNLSIVKSAEDLDGPPLYEGDVVGYAITVTNPGTVTHTNVAVQDAIPTGTTYVEGSADPPQTSGPDPLVWMLATLDPDESQTFTFQVTVDEGMAGQTIGGNVAAVASDQQIDPRTTPPTWPPGGGQVEPKPEVPPLSIVKIAGDVNGPPLLVGDEVEYHVLLFNAATITATEVWIEDYIPANTGYVPGSATTTNGTISGPDPLRVDAAEQLPLEMLFFQFRVTVDPVSSITTITNTATAAISGQAPVEAQAIIGPVGGDDVGLVIGKVVADVNGPPLYEGDTLEYTIGLANTDDVTHTHVVVTDAIPYGTSYVEGSAEPPQASGPDPLLWTVEDLPAKEIVFFTFRVTVDEGMAGQSIGGNVAIANSEQQDEPVQTPPVYPPPVSPDDPPGWVSPPGLSLAKIARDVDGPPLYEGDVVRYTITVTNDTTDTTHTDVVLQDAIPAGLTYVAGSATPPQDEGPNPLVWRLGDLAPGEDATVVFEVTVDEGMAGQMIPGNVAVAVSEQLEEPIVTPPITPPDPEVQPRPSPEPTYVYLPLILKSHEVFRPPTPTPPIGDEYEPDDSCGEAKSITPGSSQARTFEPAGDEDWIELTMTAGQSYAIQTGDLAGGADTILQLYASDCLVLLAENDDYEPDTLWSRIEWTATETASHYLRVRNYDPTIGGEGVSYSISVQQIP